MQQQRKHNRLGILLGYFYSPTLYWVIGHINYVFTEFVRTPVSKPFEERPSPKKILQNSFMSLYRKPLKSVYTHLLLKA